MYVKVLSTDAGRLNDTFDSISKLHYNWLLAGLGETHPTNLGPFADVVVPQASARVAENFNVVEGADHFTICRPSSKILRNFSKLREFIHRIDNDVQEDHANATTSKVARLPLSFPQDPKYVIQKTTMIEVQKALKSRTTGSVVTLCGGTGQGKTCMAKYLALYYQNASTLVEDLATKDQDSSRFTDGVVFLPCCSKMESKELLFKLWKDLGYELLPLFEVNMQPDNATESFISDELKRRLFTQKVLIILDDAYEPILIERLLFPGQYLKYLITTQKQGLWTDARFVQIPLSRPTLEEACKMLLNHVYGRQIDITPPLQNAVNAIVEKADHHPLVIAIMATNIRTNIEGENVHELEAWKNTIRYFEVLIQEEDASSGVLFHHMYPKSMKAAMTMALSSLSKPAQTLLLVASIFESHPAPVPEVVFKLFFERVHGTLAHFSRCSKHLEYNNFIQIYSQDVPWSTRMTGLGHYIVCGKCLLG